MNFIRLFSLLLLLPALSRAGDLDAFLADPEIWNTPAKELAGKFKDLKFSWSSADHASARLVGVNRLFDVTLAEVTLGISEEKPTELNIVFYDRGDSGEMGREAMLSLVSNLQIRVGQWMGAKGVALNDQLKTMGVRRDGMMWTNPKLETRLLSSYSTKDASGKFGFRAEYVKMRVALIGAKTATAQPATGAISAGSLKSKLKREANGDVVLEGVPMVDQGEKGYCAVASAERVMRFYGMNVDQHELAQLASSSAESGTDPRAMLESLRRVGVKIGCKVKVIEDFSVQELLHMIDRYNSAAKKQKKPAIAIGGRVLDLAAIYQAMDSDILREVRTKSPQDMKGFLADVTKNVDAVIPVLWGVQLGKVVEKPALPQAAGGHMRLIIGYNAKTSEILYTDSWGRGHELKRMPLNDAWTITCSLFTIEPRHGIL